MRGSYSWGQRHFLCVPTCAPPWAGHFLPPSGYSLTQDSSSIPHLLWKVPKLPIKSDFFPLNSYSSNYLLAILHLDLLLPNTKVTFSPLESILILNQNINSWVRMYITTTAFQKSFTYACPAISLLGIYPQEIIKDMHKDLVTGYSRQSYL